MATTINCGSNYKTHHASLKLMRDAHSSDAKIREKLFEFALNYESTLKPEEPKNSKGKKAINTTK